MNSSTHPGQSLRIHHGPSPGIVAIVYTALFVTSLVLANFMTGGARVPRPSDSLAHIRDYYLQFADAIQVTAFLQFGSAIPLGIFTATIVSRLRFHRISAASVDITFFGGMGAAFMMALSGFCTWIVSQPGIATNLEVMHMIQLLGFSCGGAGHVVMLGLLFAGISMTAAYAKLMPGWLVWCGLILAFLSELSALSFLFPICSLFIPLGRYLGFVWLIGAGMIIPNKVNPAVTVP